MNALVRKELRVIAPAWGVAVLAMAAGPTGFTAFSIDARALCLMTFWLAMTLLGLSSFGREFSSGSFSGLLAQPIARERLWRVKSRWVGLASISLFGLSLFLWTNLSDIRNADADWGMFLASTTVGLALLTGGLWTTLLFRQFTAALWITLLIPGALALAVAQLTEWLTAWREPAMQDATPNPQSIIPLAVTVILILYSIAGYWWARRLFLRAQDVGWAAAEKPLVGVGCWFKANVGPVGEPRLRPLRALAIKELQLHSLSLFFAVGVLVLHLAAIGVRKFGEQSGGWREAASVIWGLWFILPLIAGAEAVASERQLGTMEGQLCLPARRRTQFALKLCFVLVVGVILGGVMPVFLENLAVRCGAGTDALGKFHMTYSFWLPHGGAILPLWFGVAAGLTLIACYASSLTRTTLQAMGGVFVGVMVIWATIGLGSRGGVKSYLWQLSLLHVIGGPSLAVVLIGLSYWNFKRLHHAGQLWRRNLAVLGVWLAFTVVVTPLVYHRAWELVLPLEPQHGPARISSVGRVELCFASGRAFILLPDGRLWISTEAAIVAETGKFRPVTGEFIGGSNWTALAATHAQTAALQADGSLWTVFDQSRSYWLQHKTRVLGTAQEPPKRIGTATEWKMLSAQGDHFLALKQDGSIWGWGDNSHNQLGEGPKQFTNGPVRIGTDSDWTAVFASGLGSAAVKRDGSVWMWGGLYHLPDGTTLKQILRQPTPIRWNLPGTNLASLHSIWAGELALYRDGSVWAVGGVPRSLLNDPTANPGSEEKWWEVAPVVVTPVRINPDGNWRGIASGAPFVAVHADGSLWRQDDWWKPREFSRPKKVGDNRDWLAATVRDQALLTLAADGTLCGWAPQSNYGQMNTLLGPKRGPLWSLNIFESVK